MNTGPDYSSLVLGADLSHFQLVPDFPKLVSDGVKFVILKATQGFVTDPMFEANRQAATDAGLLVAAYPFLTPSDTVQTVQNFLMVSGGLVPALDWERSGVTNLIVQTWMDGCEAKLNRQGLVYRGIYPPDSISKRVAQWPWWLARYNSSPGIPPWSGEAKPDWSKEWLIWQNTNNGHEPGVTTAIDLDRLACPLDVFRTWIETGKLNPYLVAPAAQTPTV